MGSDRQVRSRKTQQLVNGSWRSVPGASDLPRNEDQQDVLIKLATKLRTFESPTDLSNKIEEISNAFVVDDGLSLSDTLSLAWSLRDIDVTTIQRLVVHVKLGRTTSGQSILRATGPFDEVLEEFYPELLVVDVDEIESAASPAPWVTRRQGPEHRRIQALGSPVVGTTHAAAVCDPSSAAV